MFDQGVAERYFEDILSAGSTMPASEEFRNFRGRDPDPNALLRRFKLQ